MSEEKTIFEKIIAGEIPCFKIYEDAETFAFLDINPNKKGHALVIPKKAHENIYELPDEIAGKLFQNVKKIAIAIKKAVNADGINILMNNEETAGQIVFHAHIHIIPRHKNDGGLNNKYYKYKEGEAESVTEQISKELN